MGIRTNNFWAQETEDFLFINFFKVTRRNKCKSRLLVMKFFGKGPRIV
jgi:hypothetical protein